MNRYRIGFSVVSAIVFFAAAAGASTWGGHNGTITLSFSDSSYVQVLDGVEPIPKVGAIVDLYAILGDCAPLTWKDEKVLALGGFELKLKIEGCESKIRKYRDSLHLPGSHIRPSPDFPPITITVPSCLPFLQKVLSQAFRVLRHPLFPSLPVPSKEEAHKKHLFPATKNL